MSYSPLSRLALRTAVGGDRFDASVFAQWQASVDLDHLPPGQYALLPLIYSNLARHGIDDHPWLSRLRGIYRKMWYANQLTLRTVAEIAAVLASAGLPVMVVGSAALAATVYPDLAQRPIVPPELVVADADAVTALQTLQSLGWRPEPASPHLLDAEFRAWVPGQRMVNAQAQALRIGWRVMPAAPCVELDATCWAVVVPLPLETATVTMLCPTDQLLYACLAASEGMLIALADVALLVRQTTIDWPRLLEIAGRYRLGLAVLAALETLVDVPGLAVPADALDALRRQPVSASARRVQQIVAQAPDARTLADRAWLLWVRYQRVCVCNGASPGLRSFSAFIRYTHNLSSVWEIPLDLARRAFPRATTHGAP